MAPQCIGVLSFQLVGLPILFINVHVVLVASLFHCTLLAVCQGGPCPRSRVFLRSLLLRALCVLPLTHRWVLKGLLSCLRLAPLCCCACLLLPVDLRLVGGLGVHVFLFLLALLVFERIVLPCLLLCRCCAQHLVVALFLFSLGELVFGVLLIRVAVVLVHALALAIIVRFIHHIQPPLPLLQGAAEAAVRVRHGQGGRLLLLCLRRF
mmetsp:Transcript_31397/g.78804  ORF Transcript_31397/g.78804 Transcript_31397/m.78804 type:complete len:208 (-) Transcript_31397:546-1169(-)